MTTTADPPTTDERSDPMPLDEFEQRARDATARLRGEQLTFDVGAGRKDAPDFASLKIAGPMGVARDLRYSEHVTVTVSDAHGEVIAEVSATVGYPAWKDHFDKYGTKTVERIHAAQVDTD